MKIYLLIIHYYYDESTVLGAYATYDLAAKQLEIETKNHAGNYQVRIFIDTVTVIGEED
jgi:hypothetical protein